MLPKAEDADDGDRPRPAPRRRADPGPADRVRRSASTAPPRSPRVPGVTQLAFGPADFRNDIGCDDTPEALLLARSTLVLAARVAGIAAPLDGPCFDLRDPAATTAEARHAKSLGFGGKLCIHPAQVAGRPRRASGRPKPRSPGPAGYRRGRRRRGGRRGRGDGRRAGAGPRPPGARRCRRGGLSARSTAAIDGHRGAATVARCGPPTRSGPDLGKRRGRCGLRG